MGGRMKFGVRLEAKRTPPKPGADSPIGFIKAFAVRCSGSADVHVG